MSWMATLLNDQIWPFGHALCDRASLALVFLARQVYQEYLDLKDSPDQREILVSLAALVHLDDLDLTALQGLKVVIIYSFDVFQVLLYIYIKKKVQLLPRLFLCRRSGHTWYTWSSWPTWTHHHWLSGTTWPTWTSWPNGTTRWDK